MSDDQNQRFELAEQLRRGARRDDRRRAVVTVVAIVAAVAGLGAFSAWQVAREDASALADDDPVPAHATDDFGFTLTPSLATDGKTKGKDPVEIALWEDFLCPSCGEFHAQSGDYLRKAVRAGDISITYHPFTFLLEATTNRYAQRAANAAACVADDAGVLAYSKMHDLLLENQPDEGGKGPGDQRLLALAKKAGAGDIEQCVEDEEFAAWVEAALVDGRERDVSTTPTIRIDGDNVVDEGGNVPSPDELRRAVEQSRG